MKQQCEGNADQWLFIFKIRQSTTMLVQGQEQNRLRPGGNHVSQQCPTFHELRQKWPSSEVFVFSIRRGILFFLGFLNS